MCHTHPITDFHSIYVSQDFDTYREKTLPSHSSVYYVTGLDILYGHKKYREFACRLSASIPLYSHYDIDASFMEDIINDTGDDVSLEDRVILYQRDEYPNRGSSQKDGMGSIRSFAILTIFEDNYYVDIVCRAPSHTMKRRSNTVIPRGQSMISVIKELAKLHGKEYIMLHSLKQVITYYTNVCGFHLINPVNEKPPCNDTILSVWLRKLDRARSIQDIIEREDYIDRIVSQRIFTKTIPDFYKEPPLSVRNIPEYKDDIIMNGYAMKYSLSY